MMIARARKVILRLPALGFLGAALFVIQAMAQDTQQPAPDNSKANKQEKNSATADKQKMNPADRETARKIRAAIHDDKTLSTYAHNVKVIVQNGQVTLKGPVRSEDEKSAVETKATAIAGAGNVTNNLTVAPKSKS
jgi:hyperosmotically inducible protein